jgi:hypothetical protein
MEYKPNSNDSNSDEASGKSPKSLRLLTELMMRGARYREEEEYEIFGGKVTIVFKPIPDQYYTPLMVGMMELSGLDEDEIKDELEAAIDQAVEEGEGATDEESISLSIFRNPEMMEILKELCYRGIDAKAMDGDDEMLSVLIDGNPEEDVPGVVGGYLLEWGFKIMELSGNLMDAQKFRGGRNRV